MHGDPLARPNTSLVDHRAEGGCEPAAKACRGFESHRVGKGHQVQVGLPDSDILREGPPVREPGLKLVVADLLMAA